MSDILTTTWNSVEDILPAKDDWKIVRCVDKNGDEDFYFMACFHLCVNGWEFFDDKYNDDPDEEMKVTHWSNPLPIELPLCSEKRMKNIHTYNKSQFDCMMNSFAFVKNANKKFKDK